MLFGGRGTTQCMSRDGALQGCRLGIGPLERFVSMDKALHPNSPEMHSFLHGSQDLWKTSSLSPSEDANEL